MQKLKKTLFLTLGHLSVTLGVIGAFLPILPTTPFLLLAVYFYSKSSNKLHHWIINHKHLGPPIILWEKNGVIRPKAKILATIMIGLVMVLKLPNLNILLAYKIIIAIILTSVLVFIWSRPSKV